MPTAQTACPEVFYNTGFESSVLTPWEAEGGTAGGPEVVLGSQVPSGAANTGNYAAYFAIVPDTTLYAIVQPYNLPPACVGTYTFTAAVQVSSGMTCQFVGDGAGLVYWYEPIGPNEYVLDVTGTDPPEWVVISGQTTVPSRDFNNKNFSLSVNDCSAGTGSVYLDDITFMLNSE